VFLIANDFTALTVAIPDMESELDTTLNRTQWVINAYTVVFGVLIVTGGRLADLFGRKRIFLIGASIFASFSLLGGLAPDIGFLIAARAAMAVGGAMVWPAVLGMTYGLLPEEKAGLAGGLIIGVAGIGNAIGPLLGGLLTDTVGWRWVFFLNVPITLVAMFVTYRRVDETSEGGERRIDYRGIATMSSGVILLLIGLDQGTVAGFGDPAILGLFVVGALLLGGFAVVERAAGEFALVPRQLVASRQFTAAISAVLMMSAIFFAVIVFVPQFMENELGWSALAAGAGLLPLMVVFAATSFVAGPLYNRLGEHCLVGARRDAVLAACPQSRGTGWRRGGGGQHLERQFLRRAPGTPCGRAILPPRGGPVAALASRRRTEPQFLARQVRQRSRRRRAWHRAERIVVHSGGRGG
jgi:EmrB/QacA subfamily drug resistance transporter